MIENKTKCPNCENEFNTDYEFCPHCGQKNKVIRLGFRYLLNDFLAGSFNIDSKFFLSFRYLITKPAFLSNEFLNAKRTKYLTPLRIYLLVSLVYFTMLSITNDGTNFEGLETMNTSNTEQSLDSLQNDTSQIDKTEELKILTLNSNANSWETLVDSAEIDTFLGVEKEKFKLLKDREGRRRFWKKFNDYISVSMFFIMPLAALILFWFFGRKSYYFEHLVFLIHLQSLIFLILIFIGFTYFIFPFSFIESIGDILVILSVVVWIKYFYSYKWVKSFFASVFFILSYFMILGLSFLVLLWVSLWMM